MKKILVIDDERYINRLIEFNLGDEGYEVLTELSGAAGLENMKKNNPDLVILDIAMPEMDGLEVLQKMKEDHSLAGIPVIILTAKVMEEVEKKAKALHADAFLTKPFSPADLIEVVGKIIG
ncbi:MAG: response regulator [Acidobacteria bacterium]|nr:response regulator [Acidobacteriota bacterium]